MKAVFSEPLTSTGSVTFKIRSHSHKKAIESLLHAISSVDEVVTSLFQRPIIRSETRELSALKTFETISVQLESTLMVVNEYVIATIGFEGAVHLPNCREAQEKSKW